MFKLTLLGTGNAAGMPWYGCECNHCAEIHRTGVGERTPCSALLEIQVDQNRKQYLIDAGQVNLHQRFAAHSLSGIFITHFHPDHVQGLFHLRWGTNLKMPVYTPPDSEGCSDLYKHPGILDFCPQKKYSNFQLDELKVLPLPLIHSKPTFGYVFEFNGKRLAYLTDTKGLPPKVIDVLAELNPNVIVIDCSYRPGFDGKGHNNLDDILSIQQQLKSEAIVLTHIGHDMDVWLKEHPNALPKGISAGFDGMEILVA